MVAVVISYVVLPSLKLLDELLSHLALTYVAERGSFHKKLVLVMAECCIRYQ